jgi:hypothetical protein
MRDDMNFHGPIGRTLVRIGQGLVVFLLVLALLVAAFLLAALILAC